MDSIFLNASLSFANSRVYVFPVYEAIDGVCACGKTDCDRPAKHPRTINGLKDATIDPAIIRTWWELWPNASIGVNCGMSNLIVVDVDTKNGKLGVATMRPIMEAYPEPFALAPITLTPSGGRHIWFQGKTRSGQGVVGPGVDVRSEGGYAIAPPSIGVGGSYSWLTTDGRPLLPMPPELLTVFAGRNAPMTPGPLSLGTAAGPEREPGARESVPCGEHRESVRQYAWHLRRVQGLSAQAAFPLLQAFASNASLLEGLDPARPFTNSDLWKLLTGVPANVATNVELTTERITGEDLEAQIKPTDWFIRGFVPIGELMLLYGKSTAGKSTWFAWLAARITQTDRNFGFIGSEDKCGVFFEKAKHCGANMKRLFTAKGNMKGFYLDNKDFLGRLIDEWGLSFLYFDKIYKHFPSSGDNARAVAQATLDPAMEVAQKRLCTIGGTLHPNKADVYSGSTEMVNIPRIVLKATAYGAKDIGLYVDAEYSNLKKPTDKDGNEIKMAFEKDVYPIFGTDGLPMMETTYAPEGITKDIFETFVWKRIADVPKGRTTLGENATNEKEMSREMEIAQLLLNCPDITNRKILEIVKGSRNATNDAIKRVRARHKMPDTTA